MRNQAGRWVLVLGLALCPTPGPAQEQSSDDHAGQPSTALGEVHFPVACTPEAQARFDRAMLLQHSFWYQQAAEALGMPLQVVEKKRHRRASKSFHGAG